MAPDLERKLRELHNCYDTPQICGLQDCAIMSLIRDAASIGADHRQGEIFDWLLDVVGANDIAHAIAAGAGRKP